MQNFLERFGSNFLIAAFVPSLTFVTMSWIFFGPILFSVSSDTLLSPLNLENENIFSSLGQYGLIIFLFSIMIGFSLSSLNNFILKVLEGYVLLEHFPFLLRAEKKRARKISTQLDRVSRRARILDKRAKKYYKKSASLSRRYNNLYTIVQQHQYALASEYQQSFPLDEKEIMPTRFGNTLKSAEYYPLDRYGIDAVKMWPRLISVIRKDYMKFIEQAENSLSFIVNSGVLCLIFGLVSFSLSIYIWLTRYTLGKPFNASIYFVASLLAFAAAYIFHRASLFSVSEYGEMIRSAYDLFRIPLMQALHIPLQNDSQAEKIIWSVVCEFIKIGDYRGEITLEYDVPYNEQFAISFANEAENDEDSSSVSE